MALPKLNQLNTKILMSGQHQQEPRHTVIKTEMCFRTPSQKGKLRNQPNWAVAEGRV
jgi:hypothetical protein